MTEKNPTPKHFENNIDRYNFLSQDYDAWYDDFPSVFQKEVETIKQVMKDGKSLEIGAGSGRFTEALGIELGLEPSDKLRALAKSRGLKIIPGVAESLPFEDASFDQVLFLTSLEFVEDRTRALSEAKRVLRQDGHLIIAYLNYPEEEQIKLKTSEDSSLYYADANFMTKKDLEELLGQQGLYIEEMASLDLLNDLQIKQDDSGIYAVLRAVKQ